MKKKRTTLFYFVSLAPGNCTRLLKLPGISHHEVKVHITVNGCTNTSIVVEELFLSHLTQKSKVNDTHSGITLLKPMTPRHIMVIMNIISIG